MDDRRPLRWAARPRPSGHSRRRGRPQWALAASLGLLALLALLAGCPDKKAGDPTCKGDGDCPEGLHCVNQTCLACADDSHCPAGQRCVSGACQAPTEPICRGDDECPAGQACVDGACKPCQSDGECGPGGKCNAGECERPSPCDVDTDCADDEDCVEGRCQKPWMGERPDALQCELATIYFDFDQATIRTDARDQLASNAECLGQAQADSGVYVTGHTDEQGTEEYNIALSERRARAVAEYLERLGIDPSRLQVVAKGETSPSGGGDEQDRRVEFEWR
ncbi:OmpA family protein [Haliangium sp.]|uniref:OmpA family protein n=1 Tax=Haliangium sp. TaxID=2663208 RepID=UPI003D0B3E1B